MMRALLWLSGALLVLVSTAGCSMSDAVLAPVDPVQVNRQIERSVRVMPVTGGYASKFGREAYIENEQWQAAVTEALSDARIFRAVQDSGEADLNLHSEIITITTEGGVSPAYAMVVQYWLVDAANGEEIWRRGINSRHQVQWNEAFAGGTRTIMAIEGAAQKNLAQFIEALEGSDL